MLIEDYSAVFTPFFTRATFAFQRFAFVARPDVVGYFADVLTPWGGGGGS